MKLRQLNFVLLILFLLVISTFVFAVNPLVEEAINRAATAIAKENIIVENGVAKFVKGLDGRLYPYASDVGQRALADVFKAAKEGVGAKSSGVTVNQINNYAGNNARIINQMGTGNSVTGSQNVGTTPKTTSAKASTAKTPKTRVTSKSSAKSASSAKATANAEAATKIKVNGRTSKLTHVGEEQYTVLNSEQPTATLPDETPPKAPEPKFKLSKLLNGWTLVILISGIDELVISRSDLGFDEELGFTNDSAWQTTKEMRGGVWEGIIKYGSVKMVLGTVNHFASKIAANAVLKGGTAPIASKLASFTSVIGASLTKIIGGATIGGAIAEYMYQKDWVDYVKKDIEGMKDIYQKDIVYNDSDEIRINYFSEDLPEKPIVDADGDYIFEHIRDAENSQINFKLKNGSVFLEKIVPADVINGDLPVFIIAPEKNLSIVSNSFSNLSKVYWDFYRSKIQFTNPEKMNPNQGGWRKFWNFTDKVISEASFGIASMRRRVIIQTEETFRNIFKTTPPVSDFEINLLTTSKEMEPTVLGKDGFYCNSLPKANDQVINCEFHAPLSEGLYFVEYRQNHGLPTYLSTGALVNRVIDEGFEANFEKYGCGLTTDLGNNFVAKNFFCGLSLNGSYDLISGEFTQRGKEDIEKYLTAVENYRKFITFEPTIGLNLVNDVFPQNDIDFMDKLVNAKGNWSELSKYKYFLATALYGYPTYTILVSGDPNSIIEKYDGFLLDPDADKYIEGKSIIYYVKLLNSKFINTSSLTNKAIVQTSLREQKNE